MSQEYASENQNSAPTAPQNPVNVGRIDNGDDGDLPARSRMSGPGSALPSFLSSTAATKPAPRRSFFSDEKGAPASSVTLSGEKFDFDPLSDEARSVYDGCVAQIAEMMGLTEEEFLGKETFTTEQRRVKDNAEVALHEFILADALRTWSLPRNCTEENKKKLHPDLKRDIAEAIIAFSVHGVGEARFRRAIG